MKTPSSPRVSFLSLRLTEREGHLFHAVLSIQLQQMLNLKVYIGKLVLLLCSSAENRLFPEKWYLLMNSVTGEESVARCGFGSLLSRTQFSVYFRHSAS